jgi:RNA polymerase sigma-70 factor (ECF subfamily)
MKSPCCGVYSRHTIGLTLIEPPLPFPSSRRTHSATPRGDLQAGDDGGEDRELDRRLLTPASVEVLFRQSYRSIVQSLALAGGDLFAAEDATQEAFAQAWLRWNRISRYDNPGAWVRRVAINKQRNAHRSRLRGEAAVSRLAHEAASLPAAELESDLVVGLRGLPYKQRLCAVLFYVDGLSTAEVAEAVGISQGSVSQHLNRARTALRAHLEVTP